MQQRKQESTTNMTKMTKYETNKKEHKKEEEPKV